MKKKYTDKVIFWYGLLSTILFVAGILIGWICPIEGPIDYVYDDYASQPAHKRPNATAPKKEEVELNNIDDYCDEASPSDAWFFYVYCRAFRALD